MLKLEPRPEPSKFWGSASPILALLITVIIGVILFLALGKDPVRGLGVFFWEPIRTTYAVGELMVKATPLLIIALGLAVCFRSNVWNIGAEGQFVMGAVFASGIALMAEKGTGGWIIVPILVAGILGGMLWAGIVALLRDKFNASEILVSLMLVGALEVAGPIGQLTPYVPAGYGFAAIIVAFVGRLHPVGMIFSAILMSMFYIGGELAQSRLGLPKSLTGVFQGLLLFALLACDTLIAYRVRWVSAVKSAPDLPAVAAVDGPKAAAGVH
jgi:ABC-type uncharacterized transport system permease subunit